MGSVITTSRFARSGVFGSIRCLVAVKSSELLRTARLSLLASVGGENCAVLPLIIGTNYNTLLDLDVLWSDTIWENFAEVPMLMFVVFLSMLQPVILESANSKVQ